MQKVKLDYILIMGWSLVILLTSHISKFTWNNIYNINYINLFLNPDLPQQRQSEIW